eukprot:9491917-Pyramimonas_sp.AAC.1
MVEATPSGPGAPCGPGEWGGTAIPMCGCCALCCSAPGAAGLRWPLSSVSARMSYAPMPL